LCYLPNIVWVIKSGKIYWAGRVAGVAESEMLTGLVEKHEGRELLVRPELRWGDNIKTDVKFMI
jgi:hypothetical protein